MHFPLRGLLRTIPATCRRPIVPHHSRHCQRATQPFFRPQHRSLYSNMADNSYADVPLPERCYADFCLVPVGTATVSVAEEVAEVQRLLRASGLTYTMHSAGTTLEGSWEDVFRVIGQAHTIVHKKGVLRVQTSMRVGTRTDKKQSAKDKVQRVEDILAKGDL